MDRASVMSNRGGNQTSAPCGCHCWWQRLLEQGCLHNICHRCYANSNDSQHTDDCVNAGSIDHKKIAVVCATCEAQKSVAANSANDVMPFYVGSTTVPQTTEGLIGCEYCVNPSQGATLEEAAYFCDTCTRNFFCHQCKGKHDKLCSDLPRVSAIDECEALRLAEHRWARIPEVVCHVHKLTCDHWCNSCRTARCQQCAKQCSKKLHSFVGTDHQDLAHWKLQLQNSTVELENANAEAKRVKSAWNSKRIAEIKHLKESKTRILDALDQAFDDIEETLNLSWEESCHKLESLRRYIDSALNCSRLLMQHPQPSHGILMFKARSAIDVLIQIAQSSVEREEAVLARLGSIVPTDDLQNVMRGCLGYPVHDPSVSKQTSSQAGPTIYDKALEHWRDIALTTEGHVLVAAGEYGLKELDAEGILVEKWQPERTKASSFCNDPRSNICSPTKVEEVVAVDCLADSRVVVALKYAHAVVLLEQDEQKSDNKWREQTRFDLGEAAPFAVAARSNRLVVALGSVSTEAQLLLPGKQLVAFDLDTKHKCAEVEVSFAVDSVALAVHCATIVSSHFRVETEDEHKGKFVLESLSADLKTRLWRISRNYPILGIATSASGTLICASIYIQRGMPLVVLDADTGFTSKDASVTGYNCDGNHKRDGCFERNCKASKTVYHKRERNSRSYVHHDSPTFPEGTAADASKLGRLPSWSTAAFRLSCSTNDENKVVALGRDEKTMFWQTLADRKSSPCASFLRAFLSVASLFNFVVSAAIQVVSFIIYVTVESIPQRYLGVAITNLDARLTHKDQEHEIVLPFLMSVGSFVIVQRYVREKLDLFNDDWIQGLKSFWVLVKESMCSCSMRSSAIGGYISFIEVIQWIIVW